jgi:ComF family protein
MMFASKGSMRRTVESWADRAKKMLGPGQGECRYCKAAFRIAAANTVAGYPAGLCRECSRAIPWIKEVVCSVCGRYEECPDCARRSATYFARNRSAVVYDDRMKAWLARYKYRGDERLAELLADVLLHAYRLHGHGHAERAGEGPALLTFVPLSGARKQDRGFNQAEQLARILGRRLRLPVIDLLQRNRHTEKQSLKSRGDRLKDMSGLFSLHEEGLRELRRRMQGDEGVPYRIYVIDDVYTTGSTLNECAKAIRAGMDARVYGVTLAR